MCARYLQGSWLQKSNVHRSDMCVQDDGRYYTDDSFYADTGMHYGSTEKGQRLQGNTIDKVFGRTILFVYLKTFEQFIAKQQKFMEYRNLARTGVRIEGAPYMTFEDASTWVGKSLEVCKIFDSKVTTLLEEQESVLI